MAAVSKRSKKQETKATEIINTNKISQTEEPRYSLKRKEENSKLRRCCSWMKYVILVLLVPPLVNYAALSREARLLRTNGELYDVGWGQKLYLHCMGTSEPTVVLDVPAGMTSDVWAAVQPIVARHAKTCVYDRGGLGFSDRAYKNTTEYAGDTSQAAMMRDRTQPGTIERMADDLHRLLTLSSSQPKPFVIVGVELSTLLARFYATLYEGDVDSLILVDPMVEDPSVMEEVWIKEWLKSRLPQTELLKLTASLGWNRLALMLKQMKISNNEARLPEDIKARRKYLLCQPRHMASAADEYFFVNESLSQMKTMFRLKPFPESISVTVVTFTAKGSDPSDQNWRDNQSKLLKHVHKNAYHKKIFADSIEMALSNPQLFAEIIIHTIRDRKSKHQSSF